MFYSWCVVCLVFGLSSVYGRCSVYFLGCLGVNLDARVVLLSCNQSGCALRVERFVM